MALDNAEYTLYSSPFSLYSMMARHTVQLGPTTPHARPPRKITLSFVNHSINENLNEDYLRVNPKGQVPAMTGTVLEQPLTDSCAISLHLAEKHYPAMLPVEHAAVIRDLLQRIHDIYGLSFSNKNPTAEMTQHNPSPVEGILQRTDLSPEYRVALEAKLGFHNANNAMAFRPDIVAKARTDLQTIFAEITEHRRQSSTTTAAAAAAAAATTTTTTTTTTTSNEAEWTFGTQTGPTVLDSHLLPLVLRCIDAGNSELVPEELQRWAGAKVKGPVWQKVMHGRPTKWDPSMGPVADMQETMSL